jgi:hypothetical protein
MRLVGDQTVDVLVRFQMGQGQEAKTLICEFPLPAGAPVSPRGH